MGENIKAPTKECDEQQVFDESTSEEGHGKNGN